MMKFQVFLLVCLPFIAKAVFIPINNDENPFYGSQYTSFPLQPAFNLQRSSYNPPQSKLIPLPGFGNLKNFFFPNKLTLSDIFQLKRTVKNLDTIIAEIKRDVQEVKMQVQDVADAVAEVIVTCPRGYTAVKGSCYLFQTTLATFTTAESGCKLTGGFLALPDISVANDAFGINIAGAFPESTTNPFFIGVRSTIVPDELRDLNENIIENTNPRFDGTNPTSTDENIGVFVAIPTLNFGGWTTTLAERAGTTAPVDVTMAFLCQTNPI